MKKLLSILGTVSLTATGASIVVACNKPNNKMPCKKENYGDGKQQCSQDKPFDTVDNKYYFVVWRSKARENGKIVRFKNDKNVDYKNYGSLDKQKNTKLLLTVDKYGENVILLITNNVESQGNKDFNSTYFKGVYRWGGNGEPNLPEINSSTGEITDGKA